MPTALELQHFAVLDIAYTHYVAGLYICIKTNNPCHLTCYHTNNQPFRHATTIEKRGLVLPWGAYWCFNAWQEVEQTEVGDTLYHTFEVAPWMALQTKWFAFRGYVGSNLSPSVSAVFMHKHPGGLPMSCRLEVYAPGDLCYNYLTGTGLPCPDHWKSVTGLPGYDPGWYLVGNTINHWWYWDTFWVETGNLGTINSVKHCMIVKKHGGFAYVQVCGHVFRIDGVNYRYHRRTPESDWTLYERDFPLNPHTLLPWTQADIDTLQPGIDLRHTWSVGWSATGFCDEVYIVVERGINCPP